MLGRQKGGRAEGEEGDASATGKAAVFCPGQFCRARFAIFAARRVPALSRQETVLLTIVNELE